MCGQINRLLKIITYIQVLSICLKHTNCRDCIYFSREMLSTCTLDTIASFRNSQFKEVLFSKLANNHCINFSCKDCPYSVRNGSNKTRCDFLVFMEHIGITQKW